MIYDQFPFLSGCGVYRSKADIFHNLVTNYNGVASQWLSMFGLLATIGSYVIQKVYPMNFKIAMQILT